MVEATWDRREQRVLDAIYEIEQLPDRYSRRADRYTMARLSGCHLRM
jgi:hypothetical protein